MFRGASAAGNQRRAPTRLRPLAHTSQTASETLTSAAFLESCRGADRPGLACRLPSRPRRRNSVIAPRACGIVSALWTLIDGTEHLKVRDVDAPNGEHRDRRKLALAELVAQSLGHLSFGDYSWLRTNDLQYPKLPRYQAALYPDVPGDGFDTRSRRLQQGAAVP